MELVNWDDAFEWCPEVEEMTSKVMVCKRRQSRLALAPALMAHANFRGA